MIDIAGTAVRAKRMPPSRAPPDRSRDLDVNAPDALKQLVWVGSGGYLDVVEYVTVEQSDDSIAACSDQRVVRGYQHGHSTTSTQVEK
jgi:hypothetical protein